MARAYSEETKKAVLSLYEGGRTVTEISAEMSISHVTIRSMLIEAGIDLPTKKRRNDAYYRDPAFIERVVSFYKSGMTLLDIQEKEGITPKKIRALLRDAGVYEAKRPAIEKEKGNENISPEEFIRMVQTSDSFAEVERKTGLTRQAINSRYHNMKKHGVPLKKLQRKPTMDWDKLTELAKSFLEDK